MGIQEYLHLIRQYAAVSKRRRINYNELVDTLTDKLTEGEAARADGKGMSAEKIAAMRDQEYPAEYRWFPRKGE